MAEVVSVVKAKTALHADRLDMHAARITDLEESLGKHLARMAVVSELSSRALTRASAVRAETDDVTEHLDELTEIVSVLVEAVHKLMRLSDEMDSEFGARLSFLEVIAE